VKILFWGSPDFSLPVLEALMESRHDLVGVVTREDKPAGRGRKVVSTPVSVLARERGLPLLQPSRTDAPDFLDEIRSLSPDISVVAAYGKILKVVTLDLPTRGSICLHPSLLPKYRGAAPVQRSILTGDTETGVTIFQMDEGMDSGDILIQRTVAMKKNERAGELNDRLSILSTGALMELLPLIESGRASPQPQDESEVSFARKIDLEEARIDWTKEPRRLELESRAFDPWPGPFTLLDGERLRLFGLTELDASGDHGGRPGEIVRIAEDGLVIRAGSGYAKVTEFQSSGKRRMGAASWIRGRRLESGTVLGSPA